MKALVFFTLLFTILFSSVYCQNLVPNPSFEEYKSLPCTYIQSSEEFSSIIHDWQMPTSGTSDVYSKLSPPNCEMNCYSTSQWSTGNQEPRTGNFHVGIHTSSYDWLFGDYREYVQVKIPILEVGKLYYIEFFVSKADKYNVSNNNIGALLSVDEVEQQNYFPLPHFPQVNCDEIITEEEGWYKISDTIRATEPFKYLTIGNFYSFEETLLALDDSTSYSTTAYYYIDDVKITPYECPKLKMPSDTTLCFGKTMKFNVDNTGLSYQWSDGSLSSEMDTREEGEYWVQIENENGCRIRDTFQLKFAVCDLPNIITPNDDGINDFFYADVFNYFDWNFELYNRWGELVYSQEYYKGDFDGDNLTDGNYFYKILKGQEAYTGWLSIMR